MILDWGLFPGHFLVNYVFVFMAVGRLIEADVQENKSFLADCIVFLLSIIDSCNCSTKCLGCFTSAI